MECFRQIFRCLKAPFKRDKGRIIEIGPPTNFRKEELPAYFSDAETLTSEDSRIATVEKDETTIEMLSLPSSTKSKMRAHVRRMSVRLSESA
ncbi:hypothetical protein DTO013E5_262 [Penicillium roqueforti]|uniref:uncharacterized protein n=1 Tax=Penicillium roqueforti TaxID=5082 RepID=UPI00190B9B41|nr:uncharacterized protein LCP9604111_876 [Penicillium roqueforti]KAF9253350.1 hypothetical protein LCP9604111_876 [Penicillium roqueforti]KAI1838867.1 hypothetical protein CBS147337_592 [Penicillium roqueforti]KAI2682025.1 hypothetical protein CBS147355_3235 [Penicillium roqueforti]KAI2691356.1 hypothetical protein LCP963914a_1557 [Penicillium roqueforti]KAI2706639.1 hypothetical protein CBS147372_550 [Penicillium roqueforti]